MKSLRKVFVLIFFAFSISITPHKLTAQPHARLTMQVFYDELLPYGSWIYEPVYGYVWVPFERGFHPYYTNGYWEMTAYGNTWVSLYPWGWAPFHYGRWIYDSFYGWMWIPGYEWGPAWVSWRWGGGYYGWAPLGPHFVLTIGFGFYDCPYNWWVFTSHSHLYGPRHRSYYSINNDDTRIRSTSIVTHTAVNNTTNTIYATGPNAEEIQATGGGKVIVKELRDLETSQQVVANDNEVGFYRPTVVRGENNDANIRPSKFETAPRPIGEAQPVQRDRQPEFQNRGVNRNEQVERPDRQLPVERSRQAPVNRDMNIEERRPQRQPEPDQRVPVRTKPMVPGREPAQRQRMEPMVPNREPVQRQRTEPIRPNRVEPQRPAERMPRQQTPVKRQQ